MIRLASGKRYSKHGSAMVLINVRLYHLKKKWKSGNRRRMRRRDCQIQLSGPGVWLDRAQLTFPAPHSSFHRLRWLFIPLCTPCSSWSKDYLGNSPRFPCCLQGRSQLWSICYKSVLCKKCALTVKITHREGFFLRETTASLISCKFAEKKVILTYLKR